MMLELLRVLYKCETPEGMRAATEKATEVGLVLDKMEDIKRKTNEEEERGESMISIRSLESALHAKRKRRLRLRARSTEKPKI